MTTIPIQLNEARLDQKLSELEQARAWSPRVISKLETALRSADDYDLFRINPLQYAKDRGMAEKEAVDLFLYGTKYGLFEMDWHLVCAYCPQVVESFRELSNLHTHARCQFCQAENNVALDDYIQVTFTVLPQIRDIVYLHPEQLSAEDYYFKYSFAKGTVPPPGMTHEQLLAFLTKFVGEVAPGEKKTIELDLPPGRFEICDLSHSSLLVFMVDEAHHTDPQTTHVQLADGKLRALDRDLRPQAVPSGPALFNYDQLGHLSSGKHVFEIENLMDERGCFWLLEYPPGFEAFYQQYEPFLSGKKLLTTQTFRELFRTEVINSSEGIAVKDITFLFTDLKGSTAMYDQIGDPKAYFLVRQHFDTLSQAIADKSGAVVKTIGDAVMAAFENPANAVDAALTMIEKIEAFNQNISQPLYLKVGIHKGHSIAVTLNDRLDYFGQTVNIAARVQNLADANEIYVSSDVYNAPGVGETLRAHHVTPEQASVKGVSEKLQVYKIKVRK